MLVLQMGKLRLRELLCLGYSPTAKATHATDMLPSVAHVVEGIQGGSAVVPGGWCWITQTLSPFASRCSLEPT